MENLPHIITGSGTINVVVEGRPYSVTVEHPSYAEIKVALKDGDGPAIARLADIPRTLMDYSAGSIVVKDGVLSFDGEQVDSTLSERILDLMKRDLPFEPMLRFLENLMQNPSARAVRELYPFLTRSIHCNGDDYVPLPITTDGHFLAYKSVTDDYLDHFSKKVSNRPGEHVRVRRNKVNDDWGVNCSDGFHVGSLAYVTTFHPPALDESGERIEGTNRIIVVKVNPRDVVCVPSDSSCTKCRICDYWVLDDFKGELKGVMYHTSRKSHSLESSGPIPELIGVGEAGRDDNTPFDQSPTGFTAQDELTAQNEFDENDEDGFDEYDENGLDEDDRDRDGNRREY